MAGRAMGSDISARDVFAPIVEAGLAKLIKIEGSEFVDGLSLHPTPGVFRQWTKEILDFSALCNELVEDAEILARPKRITGEFKIAPDVKVLAR
jgi:hypothetical protein